MTYTASHPLTRKRSVLLLTAALASFAFQPAFAPAQGAVGHKPSAAEGRVIATDACSACHRVTEKQKPPPPVFDPDEQANIAAPDFLTIAHRHGNNATWLRQFIQAPSHPMREQSWKPDDLSDVVAYLHSLRRTRAWHH